MRTLFSAIARTFLRVFFAAVVVYAAGVLYAPDLNTAKTLAIAGLLAAIAAGLRAVTVYVPSISIAHYVGNPWGALADAFLHAFLAALLANWIDLLTTPHYHGTRDILVAIVVGVVGALTRALQGLLTTGESPAPAFGLPEPKPSAATAPVSAPPPPAPKAA